MGITRFRLSPEESPADIVIQDDLGNLAVFDGRLDHRQELLAELNVALPSAASVTDTQILLLAYRKWGEGCPEHLQGDFALALWDASCRRFVCVRDRIGVRPFYYFKTDHVFCFASEIKALRRHPECPFEFDTLRIARYIHADFEDKKSTFYHGISRLMPGQALTVNAERTSERLYWKLNEQTVSLDAKIYALGMREHLTKCVRNRLRTNRNLAFLISGGLDSSSIASIASSEMSNSNLFGFFASFPDFPAIDESEWVQLLKTYLPLETAAVRADQLRPFSMLDEIYQHLDEPFHFPNLFIYWELARQASQDGYEVIMDGMDGDTTVSHGMEYLAELFASLHWIRLARTSHAVSWRFRRSILGFLFHFAMAPTAKSFMSHYLNAAVSKSDHLLQPDFARACHWNDYVYETHQRMVSTNWPPNAHEAHRQQLTSGIIPYSMEVYDHAAAAFGLDHRHPYFDANLMSYAYSSPSHLKLYRGYDRAMQREALRGIVPEAIRLRLNKSNWSDNFQRCLVETETRQIENYLQHASELAPIVNMERLRKAYETLKQTGRLNLRDGMFVWTALSLGVWLRSC